MAFLRLIILVIVLTYEIKKSKNENDKSQKQDIKPKKQIQRINIEFENSTYKQETDSIFSHILNDDGKLGEYLTSLCLENLDGYYKLMFNLYIPKKRFNNHRN